MKLYTGVLTPEELNCEFNSSQLWGFYYRILRVKSKLLCNLKLAVKYNNLIETNKLTMQLYFLNKNIIIIENILSSNEKEVEIFQIKQIKQITAIICLN